MSNLQWLTIKGRKKMSALGTVNYQIRTMHSQPGFLVRCGLETYTFDTQLEAMKWCEEYERKLNDI